MGMPPAASLELELGTSPTSRHELPLRVRFRSSKIIGSVMRILSRERLLSCKRRAHGCLSESGYRAKRPVTVATAGWKASYFGGHVFCSESPINTRNHQTSNSQTTILQSRAFVWRYFVLFITRILHGGWIVNVNCMNEREFSHLGALSAQYCMLFYIKCSLIAAY